MVKLASFKRGPAKAGCFNLDNDVLSLRKVSPADSHKFEGFNFASEPISAISATGAPKHGKPSSITFQNPKGGNLFPHPACPERHPSNRRSVLFHPTTGSRETM
jgi:hypothetical protein